MSGLHRTGSAVTLPKGSIITFDCGACHSAHSVRLPQDVLLPPGTLVHTDAPRAGASQYGPHSNGALSGGVAFGPDGVPIYATVSAAVVRQEKLKRAAEAGRAAASELEAMDGVADDMRFLAEDWMRAARAVVESRRRDLERYDAESERLLASSKAALELARKQRQEHRQASGKLYDPADPEDRRLDEALREAEDRDTLALAHRLSGRSGLEDRFSSAAAAALESGRAYLLLTAARRADLEQIKRGGELAQRALDDAPVPSKNGGAA